METKQRTLSNMDAVLRYLKDIRRPCSIAEIHKHLGSHLAMKHVVDVMLKLVENGNIQYKVYNNSLQIFMYTGPTRPQAVSQLEEEVDRMRAELQQKRRQLASLRQTQAIFQKLLQLQEKHNAALDNWHRAFCGDVRFHGIVQEQDIECRILIERYQEMRLFCERLKYLYTNFLGTICGLEGMLVEEKFHSQSMKQSGHIIHYLIMGPGNKGTSDKVMQLNQLKQPVQTNAKQILQSIYRSEHGINERRDLFCFTGVLSMWSKPSPTHEMMVVGRTTKPKYKSR